MESKGTEPVQHPGERLLQWLDLSDLIGKTITYKGSTLLAQDFMEIDVCKQHISPLMRGLVEKQRQLGSRDHPDFQESLQSVQSMIRGHFGEKVDL